MESTDNILEEGHRVLKSGDLNVIKLLLERLQSEVFSGDYVFLKNEKHFEFLSGKKGLSRCFEVEWCLPKLLEKDYIPIRLVDCMIIFYLFF